jgi:transposase
MNKKYKERLEELEREFLMYKRQMNILSGLSNFNLIEIDKLIKTYGVSVTNKVMSDMLRRMRLYFEKEYEKQYGDKLN